MLLGVDVGGTFTDAVLAFRGRIVTAKAPSTPHDQSEGVIAAVREALRRAGAQPTDVRAFAHGMTVATNALLEGRAARAALIATEGFTDLVELGRQNRAELYKLCAQRPAPLIPPHLRFAAPERMIPEGPLRPLRREGAAAVARAVKDAQAEAVAVVLLHSYRHPEHERLLGEVLAELLPDVHVSLSHEIVGTFREFERAATTEIDAALSPLLGGYLRGLAVKAQDEGLPEPSIVQSNGGLIDLGTAAAHAAWTLLSGPAGGVAGAAFVAATSGDQDVLCFDMGGTSCDVCAVSGGEVQEQAHGEIAGRPVALPMLAVHTVGAGGGSIAWIDGGGALRVGPRSAGAAPGPASYSRGGTEPTVTDADLMLGYLSADAPLAGGVQLDRDAAERAVARLARELGTGTIECAEGIVRVAAAEMARALRVVTVQRGVDPRSYALLAFGGAGPLHAIRVAEELGIKRVLCPRASGVLAALGLVVASRRRDVQRSVLLSGLEIAPEAVAAIVHELGEQARTELGDRLAQLRATYELRYRGQSFELPVRASTQPAADELRDGFERLHQERYGFTEPGLPLELVTVRVSAIVPGAELSLSDTDPGPAHKLLRRRAVIDGAELEVDVYRGSPPAGTALAGPAVVELAESTVLVKPGWSGTVNDSRTIVLETAT